MTAKTTVPIDYMYDEPEWLEYVCDMKNAIKLESISSSLARFLNVPFDMPVIRDKVVFKVYQYIYENNLLHGEVFHKDAHLQRIFPGIKLEYFHNVLDLLDAHFIVMQKCKSSPTLRVQSLDGSLE